MICIWFCSVSSSTQKSALNFKTLCKTGRSDDEGGVNVPSCYTARNVSMFKRVYRELTNEESYINIYINVFHTTRALAFQICMQILSRALCQKLLFGGCQRLSVLCVLSCAALIMSAYLGLELIFSFYFFPHSTCTCI
jgi:hypothetical protein